MSWWWIAVSVAWLVAAGSSADDHLSEFLRAAGDGGSVEERVRGMRDVFFRRVRCGARQGIAEKLCRECLSTQRILNMTTLEDGNGTRLQELGRMSVVFLNYFLSFRTSCTPESTRHGYVGSCRVYEQCLAELHPYLGADDKDASHLESLEKILREVKAVFEPEPSKPCFSAEIVLNEVNSGSNRLQALPRDVATVLLLTSHLYSGECIDVGESVADFLDDLFLHYGNGCERVMTQSGFTKLWNDLQMQRRGKHIDHGVQESSCHPEFTENQASSSAPTTKLDTMAESSAVGVESNTFSTDQTEDVTDVAKRTSTTLVWTPVGKVPTPAVPKDKNSTTLVVLIPPSKGGDGAWESKVPPNSDLYLVGEDNVEVANANESTANPRRVRHTPSAEDHEHKNLANECLPSDDLLQRFLTPGNQVITSSEFLQLCPALVQQAVSGVCSARLKATASSSPDTPAFKGNETREEVLLQVAAQSANPWLAVASVALITAISLLGLFLLPVLKKSFFVHINAFFTGLAFGTMSGDVVLHLMPQYLGLHEHEEHGHDHDAESTLDRLFPSHLQRQLVFLLTMYLLFLVECIFQACTDGEQVHHGHSHGPVEITLRDMAAVGDVEHGEMKPKPPLCSRIVQFLRPSNLFTGISSKAAVIILADTIHNFADGMAIAVGFSTSYKDGLSTSIAVFFHELPHEIGDFAILMNCGLSYWKAFVFNLLSGMSAFLGLGLGVFTASLFREWLLCITAGLFFFVVMAEMLPDMRLESKEKWREFVVKVVGTLFGIMTMICIAMYELSAS